jgi:hypothetical protein
VSVPLLLLLSQETLDMMSVSMEDYDLWPSALIRLITKEKLKDSESHFLTQEWLAMKKQSLNEKEVLNLLERLNIKANHKYVREIMAVRSVLPFAFDRIAAAARAAFSQAGEAAARVQKVDENKNGKLDYDEFKQVVRLLKERPEVRRSTPAAGGFVVVADAVRWVFASRLCSCSRSTRTAIRT